MAVLPQMGSLGTVGASTGDGIAGAEGILHSLVDISRGIYIH